MDTLQEELEHIEFLDQCNALVEKIVLSWVDSPLKSLEDEWFDIKIFGDEPVFTDLLFSKLEAEAR